MSEQLPSEQRAKRDRITLYVDDLIIRDNYGVHGSDFYFCRLCERESGAGVLNEGIPHKDWCPLGRYLKRKEKKNVA